MKRRGLIFCAFTLSLALLGPSVQAEETGPDGLTSQALAVYLKQLQQAVKSDSAAEVAKLVSFPLRVNGLAGKNRKLNAAQFAKEYASVFTPAIKATVLKQEAKTLFRKSEGAMMGDGEVWLSGICEDSKCVKSQIKVISVNLQAP